MEDLDDLGGDDSAAIDQDSGAKPHHSTSQIVLVRKTQEDRLKEKELVARIVNQMSKTTHLKKEECGSDSESDQEGEE